MGDLRRPRARTGREPFWASARCCPTGFSPTDVGPGWHWYLDRLGADLAGTPFPAWPDYEALGEHYA